MSELAHSLLDNLRKQFPCEQIEPYGKVLVVPSRSFQPQWEDKLKSEGHAIFLQAHEGESAFFIRVDKHNSKFKKHWTDTEVEQLKELVSMGLKPSEIASKLGRTATAVKGKIQRMNLNTHTTSKLEPTELSHDIVKEFLSACSLLYPSHRKACAFLLREASNKILAEEKP